MSSGEETIEELIRLADVYNLDPLFINKLEDLKAVFDSFEYYKQPTRPDIEDESWCIWRDTSRDITILLIRSDGEYEGVEVA